MWHITGGRTRAVKLGNPEDDPRACSGAGGGWDDEGEAVVAVQPGLNELGTRFEDDGACRGQ